MKNNKSQIFLSYCWEDDKIADDIYDQLIGYQQIELHRDKIDIKHWGSIKEYMQSIPDMDYTILLISDAYLKSSNCMYEVLEVMRDRKYKNKIFPAVIYNGIYNPSVRAGYVKYWQNQSEELAENIKGIEMQNLGTLTEDLKRYKDIAANIVTFIDTVSDMNNPQISEVANVIKEKLVERGFIGETTNNVNLEKSESPDIFEVLGIGKNQGQREFTDLEVDQFMVQSFQQVCLTVQKMCQQYEKDNPRYAITVEQVDTRNAIYKFYQDGMMKTNLKISLDESWGNMNIAISMNQSGFSMAHSWNNLYSSVNVNGQLKLKATMSVFGSREEMDTNGVAKDIWENYVATYLR